MPIMPMTVDQIIEETRNWPQDQLGELLDRLTMSLHQVPESDIDQSWRQEIRRRLAEIESGRVQGIPGDEVSARVRQIVGR